jgi:hypothetical protein
MKELDKIIIDCFQFYKHTGQIIKETTIKKNYGENILNVNIMMKIGFNIFFINCIHEKCDFNIINNFNKECDFISIKLNNKYFKYHKIILSLHSLYIGNFNIINIYVNPFTNISITDYFLLKLYHYISETTNIFPGLKYYQSDDIFMTYNPK